MSFLLKKVTGPGLFALALCLSTNAQAQETNVASIRQAAAIDRSAAQFMQANTILRVQTGEHLIAAIEEGGAALDGATLTQHQVGSGHSALIQAVGSAVVTQEQGSDATHRENVAEVRGAGSGMNVVQTQSGSYNSARLLGTDERFAEGGSVAFLQEGNHNSALVDGFFSTPGEPSAAFVIEQYRDFNAATIHNGGWANNHVLVRQMSTATSADQANVVSIEFSSGRNSVSVVQQGRGNTAVIRQ